MILNGGRRKFRRLFRYSMTKKSHVCHIWQTWLFRMVTIRKRFQRSNWNLWVRYSGFDETQFCVSFGIVAIGFSFKRKLRLALWSILSEDNSVFESISKNPLKETKVWPRLFRSNDTLLLKSSKIISAFVKILTPWKAGSQGCNQSLHPFRFR